MTNNRPKSSYAELFNAVANYYNVNINANGYLAVVSQLQSIEKIILDKESQHNEILKQQSILQTKLLSIDKTLRDQVKLSKKIEKNQRIMIENQRQQNILTQKQVLLNEEQLLIQKKSLIAQEIQTDLAIKSELEKQKQSELKRVVFALHSELTLIENNENNIEKFLSLAVLEKDLESAHIDPNELEELNDKEYANKIFSSFSDFKIKLNDSLSDEDKSDLDFLKSYKCKLSGLDKELSDIQSKKTDIETRLLKDEKRINWIENNLNNNIAQLKYLRESITKYEALPKNKHTLLKIFLSLSAFVLILSVINIFSNNKADYIKYGFAFSFLIFLTLTVILVVKIYSNPDNKIKRSKKKINFVQITDENLINEKTAINNRKPGYLNEKEEIQKYIFAKTSELEEFKNKISAFFDKYPGVKIYNQ